MGETKLGSYSSKQLFKNKNSSFENDETKLEINQKYEFVDHLKLEHRSLEAKPSRTKNNFYRVSMKPLPIPIVSTTPESTSSILNENKTNLFQCLN